jgi:hypothetical protein
MVRAKTGIVRIALATNAWIIPIGLTGPQQPLLFQTRTMTVGAAFRLNQLPSYIPDVDNDMQHISALTTDVMHRITALLPSEYHGYYAHTP